MAIQLGIRRDAVGNIAINRPTGNIEEALHVDGAIQLGQDFGGGNALKMRRNPGTGAFEVDTGSGYMPIGNGVEAQLPDNSNSPDASYLMNGDILDSSGNGYDLQIVAGTETYTDGHVPGTRGFFFDGSTYLRLGNPAHDVAFQQTGDITIIFSWRPSNVSLYMGLFSCEATGVAENDNTTWGIQQGDGVGDFLGQSVYWRYGSGAVYDTVLFGPEGGQFESGNFQRLAFRRESNSWSAFTNGVLYKTTAGANLPTGGSNGFLTIGANGFNSFPCFGTMAALSFFSSAKSNSEILTDSKRVLGLS